MKLFALLCLIFLNACVVQRSVVRQPEMTLHVTDGSTPLENVGVYLYWISDPYSRLEQTQIFTTDAEGNLRLEQVLETDTAYPLFMHGVTYYHHKLCLEVSGYHSLLISLAVLPGDELQLETPLTAGQSLEVCSSYETFSFSGRSSVSRPDIAQQHESIQGAYEIIP